MTTVPCEGLVTDPNQGEGEGEGEDRALGFRVRVLGLGLWLGAGSRLTMPMVSALARITPMASLSPSEAGGLDSEQG